MALIDKSQQVLRIAFLGFNPLGNGFDGRGLIDAGADRTFTSLDTLGARRLIRRTFAGVAPPYDLRITGYSFGAWSALQLSHGLSGRYRIRLGLVDPIHTFRIRAMLGGLKWPLVRTAYARRPHNTVLALNVYQTKGLIARLDHGHGRRLPYSPRWFASMPILGFENIDRSAEVSYEAGHVEVAEKYAAEVAGRTFAPGGTSGDEAPKIPRPS